VEETIPSDNALKRTAEGKRSHVRNAPVLAGKVLLAKVNEIWRRIYASDAAFILNKISADRLARAATNIKNTRTRWQ
jgi:hypothetical protein